jgi:large subunit ribosomal protein L24
MKIKKGDQVQILTGKDKGTQGEVLKVLIADNRVLVKGVNVVKKHQKPTQFAAGGITEKELSIHASNVALLDPKSGKPTRAGYKMLKDGKKVRIARKSGEEIA